MWDEFNIWEQFNRDVAKVFENTPEGDIPYLSLNHMNGYLLIDGYISYKDLIALADVVKEYEKKGIISYGSL